MELDPTLPTKSMVVQLQTLIVDAFRCLSSLPQRSYLVIIDGLDECHDKVIQQSILRLLCETVTVHKLPLRFLIGSRPESHIRDIFDEESLYTVTRRVVLDETFDPGRDIKVFLRDGFAKIGAKNSILSHVEQPWPEEGVIDLLVQRSSGQFIYAATVLRFVGADLCSPTKQLALVLKPDPTAFSDLDQLYTQILSVYPSTVNIVQVPGFIIVLDMNHLPEVIEDILGMEEGELKEVLHGLSSLMVGDRDEGVTSYVIPHLAHASFREYLFSSSRSGPFHVNEHEYETQVTIWSFALIMKVIRSWKIAPVLHTTTWQFFTSHLPDHFCRSPEVAIMTDINDLVQEFSRASSDGAVWAPFFAIRRLLTILQICFDVLKSSVNPKPWILAYSAHERIDAKFKTLFNGYRKMLDQSLSKSKELGDMVKFLPDLLERLIKPTIEPLRPSESRVSPYILDDYLSGFLQDRDRSQLYYCDPMLQHTSICRLFLSLLDGSNAFAFDSRDFSDYVYSHFYDHLCAATTDFLHAQNISVDHPSTEILRYLETKAYYVDEKSSGYTLARSIIHGILRWANMLNCHLKNGGVGVFVSNHNLMERVCHLTNEKIYREMLVCITRHERTQTTYITMGGRLDHVQVSHSSWTPQDRIVLSWDLLTWISVANRIPSSFTNFITTQDLSGALYISPNIYHTQITEYILEKILQPSDGFIPDWNFREHFPLALPTKRIFYILRSNRSERLISDGSAKSLRDTLKIIVKWLQGLGSRRPSDLYCRFQDELLRYYAFQTF